MEAKLTAQAERMARELASQAGTIDELDGLLRGLMKSALERMLDAEMDAHLKREGPPLPFEPPAPNNRRNGHSHKTVQGELGEVKIENKSAVKSEDLLKAGNFKKGDLVNFDEINQGVDRMKKRLRRDGYMRAESKVERAIHDDKKSVAQALKEAEGKVGGPIKVTGFVRYALGEGIERPDSDFAAEVAATAGKA